MAKAGWWVLTAAGLAELAWLVVLGLRLADASVGELVGWLGLDFVQAVGLITTGLLLRANDRRAVLFAVATAALLLADAWLDTTISQASAEALLSVAVEVPLAAFCLLVTRRIQVTTGSTR